MSSRKSKPPPSEAEHLRDAIARDVFARAERDSEQAESPDARRLIAYVVEHLFDQDFSIGMARKECKVTDRAFTHAFRAVFGEVPSEYAKGLRLEVIKRLLTETELNQDEIAAVVGLSAGSALRSAFANGAGETIKQYRDRCRSQQHREALFDKKLGQRLRERALSDDEASDLLTRLQADYPEVAGQPQKLRFCPGDGYVPAGGVSRDEFEHLAAQVLWSEVEGRPLAEQIAHVRQNRSFKTTAFIDLLQRKIIEVGRLDRSRGVEVARLALTVVFDFERLDPSGRSELRARGWAWLGNALRLDLELAGAERAMTQAEFYLPEKPAALAHGEVLLHRAALRWSQRKSDMGLEVAESAIPLLEKAGDRDLLVKIFLIRGILYRISNRARDAAEDYRHVLRLLADRPNSELACVALYNLAFCYWLEQQPDQAKPLIKELKQRAGDGSFRLPGLSADWLYGRLALDEQRYDEAIECLSQVRARFQSLRSNLAGMVGIDLAIAYFQSQQAKRAIQLAREALPVLAVWREEPGFQEPFTKLELAVNKGMITLDLLVGIRNLSFQLENDPSRRCFLQIKGLY